MKILYEIASPRRTAGFRNDTRKKRLVLFDIDGTLIRPLTQRTALARFPYAIKETLGLEVTVDAESWRFNGVVDRGILWELVKGKGVSKKDFLIQLPAMMKLFTVFLEDLSKRERLYEPINDARRLVEMAVAAPHLHIGVITGNLGDSAMWKLHYTGFHGYFSFGLFGHEADTRSILVKQVFEKSELHFGKKFSSKDIVIVGDTVHDVICGKSIGAITIAVTTGWKLNRQALVAQKPDLLVDSLMDERVLDLLGLNK